jgi:signal transduction histidine kinase
MKSADPLNRFRLSLHELAQPLAAVTGLVDLMLLEMQEGDPWFREIETISGQMEKALKIVEELRHTVREASEKSPSMPATSI